MCSSSAYIFDWNQVHLIKLRTINGEVFTLSSIVSPVPFCPCNIVIGCIKLEDCSTLVNPGGLALNAPELLIFASLAKLQYSQLYYG